MSRHNRISASAPARIEPLEDRALLTTLTINGTAAPDAIDVSLNGPDYVVVVNGAQFVQPAAPVTDIVINGLAGADAIRVRSAADPVAVNGEGGDDLLALGAISLGLGGVDGHVTYDGGAGADTLQLDDDDSTGIPNYGINVTNVATTGFGGASYLGMESLPLNAADGGSVIFVNSTPFGSLVRLNTEGGTDDFQVNSTGSASTLVINSSTGFGQPDILNVVSAATVELAHSQNFSSFHVAAPARVKLQPGGNKVLKVAELQTNSYQVDLADNAMVVDYSGSPGPSLFGWYFTGLPAAYANGTWTGPGVISSSVAANPALAIRIVEATQLFPATPATFMGVSVDGTAIVLKTTLVGDANLDGRVNLQDFNRLAALGEEILFLHRFSAAFPVVFEQPRFGVARGVHAARNAPVKGASRRWLIRQQIQISRGSGQYRIQKPLDSSMRRRPASSPGCRRQSMWRIRPPKPILTLR